MLKCECDECRRDIGDSDEVYCANCHNDDKERINDLERENNSLLDKIYDLEQLLQRELDHRGEL